MCDITTFVSHDARLRNPDLRVQKQKARRGIGGLFVFKLFEQAGKRSRRRAKALWRPCVGSSQMECELFRRIWNAPYSKTRSARTHPLSVSAMIPEARESVLGVGQLHLHTCTGSFAAYI